MTEKQETFISVDIEASGPIPGEYSMLELGACNAYDETQTFQCKFKPTTMRAAPGALEVSGLSLEELAGVGVEPDDGMIRFKLWIHSLVGEDAVPVFVGLNAPFDWSFINYYFHRYVGENPFGFRALDVKSYYMGAAGCSWADTRSSQIAANLNPTRRGDHDALHDALYQAELFRLARALRP